MSDFSPPTGPPPPKLPSGWTARWNDQYSEWFYVNIYTKRSQWDKPTEPVYPDAHHDNAPPGPPPGYAGGAAGAAPFMDDKSGAGQGHLGSNNPYGAGASSGVGGVGAPGAAGGAYDLDEDEKMARRLQEEEDARGAQRASGDNRGASDSYYGAGGGPSGGVGGVQSGQYGQELPPREQKKGLLGKLSSKLGGGSSSRPQGSGYQSGGYGQGYPPQQHYGGGMQPGYGQQPMYGQPMYAQPQRRHGGLGAGGGAALGLGGGLLGGMMLGEAMDGGDGGGDYGGGGDDGGGGDGGGGDGGGGD